MWVSDGARTCHATDLGACVCVFDVCVCAFIIWMLPVFRVLNQLIGGHGDLPAYRKSTLKRFIGTDWEELRLA